MSHCSLGFARPTVTGLEVQSTFDHLRGIEKAQRMQNSRKHVGIYPRILYFLQVHPSILSFMLDQISWFWLGSEGHIEQGEG